MPSRKTHRTWERCELDGTFKAVLRAACQDLVQLAERGSDRHYRALAAADKEIAVQVHRLDGLFVAEEDEQKQLSLLHLEFKSRFTSEVAAQVASDGCAAHFRLVQSNAPPLRLPIRSVLFLAEPPIGRRATNHYAIPSPRGGKTMIYRFEVVRIYELDAAEHLRGGAPGQMPLVPLMRGATLEIAMAAWRVIEDLPDDAEHQRAELAAAFLFIAEKCFPDGDWDSRIGKELLMKSQTYRSVIEESREEGREAGREEGREKGREEGLEGQREILAAWLSSRLPDCPARLLAELRASKDPAALIEIAKVLATVQDRKLLLDGLRSLLAVQS